MKRTVRLTESDLHNIIKESVNRILSEVSTNKRAAAFVGANNYKFPDSKTMMKGNRVVDTEYEKERKERQKRLFGNSVARDVGKEIGKDRGEANAKAIRDCEKTIADMQRIVDNPNETEQRRLGAKENIKYFKDKLDKLKSDTLGFSLKGDKDGYHLSDRNGNVAFSHLNNRRFNYDDPREANRTAQMLDVTDRLMGYDDEVSQGKKLDGRVDYLERRQKNAANIEKYNKDKEDWENRKWKADSEMQSWKGKNPISRMFSKKPAEFNEPEPQRPEWDKGGGGYYFLGNSGDYDKDIEKQTNLNTHYRAANSKNKKAN